MLKLPIDLLQPGMILAKPVTDARGGILLRQNVPLSRDYILNLKRRGFSSVYISDGDTDDIVIEDMITDEVRRKTQLTLAKVFGFARHISADFVKAHSDTVVASMRDSGITQALRSYNGFVMLEDMVSSVLNDLMRTDMLTGIAQIRSYDDTTFSHSIDTTVTALMIGKRLHFSVQDLKRLGAGCLLHDIGKIFLSHSPLETRLQQQGRAPTPAEQLRLREHPRLGYELLRTRNPDAVMANHVALEHHERQDGRGYPRRLHGTNTIERPRFDRQNILLIAEIASVADLYDLLSTERPGRPALTPKQIAGTLRRLSGIFLNKEIVELFLIMLPVLPKGIQVIVRTGRYAGYKGVVVRANKKQPERPLIRLLYNTQMDRIVPIELNLTRDQSTTVEAVLS